MYYCYYVILYNNNYNYNKLGGYLSISIMLWIFSKVCVYIKIHKYIMYNTTGIVVDGKEMHADDTQNLTRWAGCIIFIMRAYGFAICVLDFCGFDTHVCRPSAIAATTVAPCTVSDQLLRFCHLPAVAAPFVI